VLEKLLLSYPGWLLGIGKKAPKSAFFLKKEKRPTFYTSKKILLTILNNVLPP
jgi:hypothetical protein